MPTKLELLPHIEELDGVRGVAIVMVMVMHFYEPVEAASPLGPLTRLIMQGGAGVDLFFVLSGFLITGILLSSKTATNYFRAFYARRVLRIFPLYVTVVALFFFIALPVLHHHGKDLLIQPGEQIWYWLFLENWRHALGYSDGAQLSHFWSLAIEEQFYLGWSIVTWFASVRTILKLSIGLILSGIVIRTIGSLYGAGYEFLHFSTVTRLDALAFGALLSVSPRARQFFGKSAPIIIPISVLVAVLNPPLELSKLAYGIGSASLVGLATTRGLPLLRMAWLRTLGKYSYGLYVLHYLIHGVIVLGVKHFQPLPFALMSVIGGSALSFTAAWISWNLLENPFLKLKRLCRYEFRITPTQQASRQRLPPLSLASDETTSPNPAISS